LRRLTCALGAVLLLGGASASAAAAARLRLSVPAHVWEGAAYRIDIRGSFSRRELTGSAFLISLIQFAPSACQSTAQKENAWSRRTNTGLQFYLAPGSDPRRGRIGVFERSSPFGRGDELKASSLGSRRVCAYLYPRFISAGATTSPIARADRPYRVTRK
jgi:hypothetical protein